MGLDKKHVREVSHGVPANGEREARLAHGAGLTAGKHIARHVENQRERPDP
jgi:hypothetical protein